MKQNEQTLLVSGWNLLITHKQKKGHYLKTHNFSLLLRHTALVRIMRRPTMSVVSN